MSSSVASGGCLAGSGEAAWPGPLPGKLFIIPCDQCMIYSGNWPKLILSQEVEWGRNLFEKMMMQHTGNSWGHSGHILTLRPQPSCHVWARFWPRVSLDLQEVVWSPSACMLSPLNLPHFLRYPWLPGLYVNVARQPLPACAMRPVRSDSGQGGIALPLWNVNQTSPQTYSVVYLPLHLQYMEFCPW